MLVRIEIRQPKHEKRHRLIDSHSTQFRTVPQESKPIFLVLEQSQLEDVLNDYPWPIILYCELVTKCGNNLH